MTCSDPQTFQSVVFDCWAGSSSLPTKATQEVFGRQAGGTELLNMNGCTEVRIRTTTSPIYFDDLMFSNIRRLPTTPPRSGGLPPVLARFTCLPRLLGNAAVCAIAVMLYLALRVGTRLRRLCAPHALHWAGWRISGMRACSTHPCGRQPVGSGQHNVANQLARCC